MRYLPLSELIISASGARGVIGESLTPERVVRLAAAFGNFIGSGRIVVGYDSRTSGPMMMHSVYAGLLATGCDILDVGMCPTPTILFMSRVEQADGSIVITASHNPAKWNGLEFAAQAGRLLNGQDLKSFLDIYHNQKLRLCSWNKQGKIKKLNQAISHHINAILEAQWVDLEQTHSRQLSVVIDAGNGVGSRISPVLLRALGCKVSEVFCHPDGSFPRPSEPYPEALSKLCQTVQSVGADLGLAHDGDADRLVIVDELGHAISSEYTFALVADFLLGKTDQPAFIVATISTSRLIEDVAHRHKAELFRVPVGVSFVVEKMKQLSKDNPEALVLGGEGTGGVILPNWQYTTDGIAAISVIVQMLAESDDSIQSRVRNLPEYKMHKIKLKIDRQATADELVRRAAVIFSQLSNSILDLTDGIRCVWPDRWVGIRKSGTEPVVRIFSEANSSGTAKELALQTQQSLQEVIMQIEQEQMKDQ